MIRKLFRSARPDNLLKARLGVDSLERREMPSSLMAAPIGSTAVKGSTSTNVAGNAHFKRQPTFVDNGLTLTASGSLAGLGNLDVTITMTVRGSATTFCTNPGGNVSPGQNKVPIELSVSQVIKASEIKNGTASFSLTSPVPATPTPKEAGCPNNNWSVTLDDVQFSSATITVVQGGQTVISKTFSF